MFHCHSLYVIFYLTWYIMCFVWIIYTFFNKYIWEKFRIFYISFIYYFKDWTPFCCINFCSSFISVNFINRFDNCFFVCFCALFFYKINWDIFIRICIFRYCQFLNPFKSVQLPFLYSSVLFWTNNWYPIILVYNSQQNELFYHFINVIVFWRNRKGFISFWGIFRIHPLKFVRMKLEFPIIPPLLSFI